jgi:hypothetical protein
VREWIGHWLFVAFVLTVLSPAHAACIDVSTLARSTVSLARIFDEGQPKVEPDVIGAAGTGWFLSRGSVVTAAHVAEAMNLSTQEWTDIQVRQRENTVSVGARVLHLLGPQAEKIAVLALRTQFPDATLVAIRETPLLAGEPVVSVAYPGRRLRFANGHFLRHGTGERLAGSMLLELHDGGDRLVIDHGASGAPVLDCEGRAVAVVTGVLSRTITLLSQQVRVSTAWATPNVVAAPVSALMDLARSD